MDAMIAIEGVKLTQELIEEIQYVQDSESVHRKAIDDTINLLINCNNDIGENGDAEIIMGLLKSLSQIRQHFYIMEANSDDKKKKGGKK